jgi:hypothetical protein
MRPSQHSPVCHEPRSRPRPDESHEAHQHDVQIQVFPQIILKSRNTVREVRAAAVETRATAPHRRALRA